MIGADFVKLCFKQNENDLKLYLDKNKTTEVIKRINTIIQNEANRNTLYELIDLLLKEHYYTMLLGIDGEASLAR
jgi:hypothetical protein